MKEKWLCKFISYYYCRHEEGSTTMQLNFIYRTSARIALMVAS